MSRDRVVTYCSYGILFARGTWLVRSLLENPSLVTSKVYFVHMISCKGRSCKGLLSCKLRSTPALGLCIVVIIDLWHNSLPKIRARPAIWSASASSHQPCRVQSRPLQTEPEPAKPAERSQRAKVVPTRKVDLGPAYVPWRASMTLACKLGLAGYDLSSSGIRQFYFMSL